MEIQKVIAENTKALRALKGLTLQESAAITGVSKSMLAQIEKGEINPTISTLWKIANGYKVSFSSLMEAQNTKSYVVRKEDITALEEDDGKYINFPIFPFEDDKHFETYRIQIKPNGLLKAKPHLNGTEEYITVFSGEVEIGADDEVYKLSVGDSIRFRADTPHFYKNIGTDDVFLSMLIYYN